MLTGSLEGAGERIKGGERFLNKSMKLFLAEE